MIKQLDYSYDKIVLFLQELSRKYNFVKLRKIGTSILGRPIFAIEIGIEPSCICYSGGFHGSERLTVTTLLLFLERFCLALSKDETFFGVSARKSLFGRKLLVVPCVNPDGYEIARVGASAAAGMRDRVLEIAGDTDLKYWNANARGVDINHNFDAEHETLRQAEKARGITTFAPRYFGGEKPESEPETEAIAQYIRQNNILQLFCFHSQGQEIYNQFGNSLPPRSNFLTAQYAAACGYRVAVPQGTAAFGGCKDWFIKTYNRPAFTFELGLGENPLPPTDLYSIYNRIEPVFLLSLVL